jgi:hypothetical protein
VIRLLLLSMMLSGASFAQEPDAVRTKFYDFDELSLEGQRKKPALLYTDAKPRARFERLFQLRRSFLPELRRSRDGSAVITPPKAK